MNCRNKYASVGLAHVGKLSAVAGQVKELMGAGQDYCCEYGTRGLSELSQGHWSCISAKCLLSGWEEWL